MLLRCFGSIRLAVSFALMVLKHGSQALTVTSRGIEQSRELRRFFVLIGEIGQLELTLHPEEVSDGITVYSPQPATFWTRGIRNQKALTKVFSAVLLVQQ